MATIKDTGATNALNEDEYINKLYDQMHEKQKNLLADTYQENTAAQDAAQQEVQQQTQANLQRTDVEAQKAQQGYQPADVSSGVNQQAALTMGNQKRQNTSTLRNAQAEADAEIERRRLLLGEQYATAIEKARADNDMLRAEQLYTEAKARDEQIRALKTEAGQMLAAKGDNSLLMSLLNGGAVDSAPVGSTWDEVLKYEDSINKIYDSANKSARLQAESETAAILSQLRANQEQKKKETDKALTDTYVKALQQGKNASETMNAYGMGSGNKAQAQLARAMGTTEDLTALRGAQANADANILQQIASAIQDKNTSITGTATQNERDRAQELFDAAKAEEQALIDTQRTVGKALAEQGDYSLLAKLYGLTQEEYNLLQGINQNAGGDGGYSYYKQPTKKEEVITPPAGALITSATDFNNPNLEEMKAVARASQATRTDEIAAGNVFNAAMNALPQYALSNTYTQAAIDSLGKSEQNNATNLAGDGVVNALKKIIEKLPGTTTNRSKGKTGF